ncbi:MAG: hypothetical protein MUE71_01030 [Chitinophagaceae bacterium]|nr:hypothetical protein [Chitinophagaceae bacterium]
MIHILTVHWKDDRWINIQLDYIKENIKKPYKVYAYVNHIEKDYSDQFYYSNTENIQDHATKLNLLAQVPIQEGAPDDDWLLFMDGDAFPIGDVVSYVDPLLKHYPLVAVQRQENLEDKQPHPLFCVTTVGFWKKYEGDWRKGYKWKNKHSLATDVGGNLLGILERNNIDWFRILRTNKKDLHVLNFAIYGDIVYHHGASFRPNISRVDKNINPFKPNRFLAFCKKFRYLQNITFYYKGKHEQKIKVNNKKLSDEVFEKILGSKEFYKFFQEP